VVLRIGHRGAAGHEPENTLRGFEAAVALGVDMVELDVYICASGEIVVIHDETVDRTTDGSGAVSELTLRELKALDAGKGERIPTLDEVFSRLRGRVGVNIELKGPGTAEPVHEFLGRLPASVWGGDNVLVTSFDWDMLGRMRELSSETRLGPLVYEDTDRVMVVAEQLCAYSVNPYHLKMGEALIEEAHELGIRVYPWTVDDPVDIRRVLYLGVDGVISNYPDRVK
jgi:glycerophosphoryl diester phosphodiesterase